jgi:hypothetical protein
MSLCVRGAACHCVCVWRACVPRAPTPLPLPSVPSADNSTCVACAAGSVCSEGRSAQCPAGTFASAGAAACSPCPPGTFSPAGAASAAACVACGPGFYCTGQGAGSRAPCPAGRFSPDANTTSAGGSGARACQPCAPASRYCPAGAATPLQPDPGFYAGGAGATGGNTAQLVCPLGTQCVAGVRLPCPPGRFANASASVACAACPAGWYAAAAGAPVCVRCAALEGSYEGAVACWPGLASAVAVDGGRGASAGLAASGLGPGDRVALQLSSPCSAVGVAAPLPVVFEAQVRGTDASLTVCCVSEGGGEGGREGGRKGAPYRPATLPRRCVAS